MNEYLTAAAFVFALAAPALAAGQFFVALDTATKEVPRDEHAARRHEAEDGR
jgi:hypothetical protein